MYNSFILNSLIKWSWTLKKNINIKEKQYNFGNEALTSQEKGIPRWHNRKESTCLCRRCKRHGFDPWVGKILWSRKWQATPVFLLGKFHGQRRLAGYSPWGRRFGHDWVHISHTHTHTHTARRRPELEILKVLENL